MSASFIAKVHCIIKIVLTVPYHKAYIISPTVLASHNCSQCTAKSTLAPSYYLAAPYFSLKYFSIDST